MKDGVKSAYVVNILLLKFCPSPIFIAIIKPGETEVILVPGNKIIDAYGRRDPKQHVPTSVMKNASARFDLMTYREEGYIVKDGSHDNYYYQFKAGMVPPHQTDQHQPGFFMLLCSC